MSWNPEPLITYLLAKGECERMGNMLTDFLLARIAEDEAEARDHLYYQEEVYEAAGWWDCDRVIVECEAKRQIVKGWGPFETYNGEELLKVLALPYADHPDYRQEWKP